MTNRWDSVAPVTLRQVPDSACTPWPNGAMQNFPALNPLALRATVVLHCGLRERLLLREPHRQHATTTDPCDHTRSSRKGPFSPQIPPD